MALVSSRFPRSGRASTEGCRPSAQKTNPPWESSEYRRHSSRVTGFAQPGQLLLLFLQRAKHGGDRYHDRPDEIIVHVDVLLDLYELETRRGPWVQPR